jgi:hypothetical protein
VNGEEDASGFQAPEYRNPPEPRSHAEVYSQSIEAENWQGAKSKHPSQLHGIKGWSVLGIIPLFDLVWDICPDIMHIIKNLFERFFGTLLAGARVPKDNKNFRKPSDTTSETFHADLANYNAELDEHKRATRRATISTLSAYGKNQIDVRCRKLAGVKKTGIPLNLVPFDTIPGHAKMKAATWVAVLRYHVPYLLYGVGDKSVREALLKISEVLRDVLAATCDFDPDDDMSTQQQTAKCTALKKKIVLAMVELERRLPSSEMCYFVHEIVHVADFIFRWNNVRNYWCFVCERFVGYVKGFVKNRHLTLESLVRFTLCLCSANN